MYMYYNEVYNTNMSSIVNITGTIHRQRSEISNSSSTASLLSFCSDQPFPGKVIPTGINRIGQISTHTICIHVTVV